ncbi:MAG: site-specific integrase [Gemmataceae bacterium]
MAQLYGLSSTSDNSGLSLVDKPGTLLRNRWRLSRLRCMMRRVDKRKPSTAPRPRRQRTPPEDRLSIDDLLEEAQRTAIESIPENTRRAYATDWNQYRNWCQKRSRVPLPASADTVSAYLTAIAKTHAISTLRRRLTMVSKVHRISGKPDPTGDVRVKQLWRGILRSKGEAQRGKKPLLVGDLRRMVDALPKTLRGDRDRALLLLGFAGGLRRSELVALDVEDLEEVEEGLVVNLRRSKTDQTGKGQRKGIPFGKSKATCPVRAAIAWLRAAEVYEGPVFRALTKHDTPRRSRLSAQTVALVVKHAFRAIGKRPRDFSAHSLRSGLVTAAAMNGADERTIMRHTGHRSVEMVRRYIRDASLFRDNPASKAGL